MAELEQVQGSKEGSPRAKPFQAHPAKKAPTVGGASRRSFGGFFIDVQFPTTPYPDIVKSPRASIRLFHPYFHSN